MTPRSSLLQNRLPLRPWARPLTPADAPLIDAEILFQDKRGPPSGSTSNPLLFGQPKNWVVILTSHLAPPLARGERCFLQS